jgi:hypothetical protein
VVTLDPIVRVAARWGGLGTEARSVSPECAEQSLWVPETPSWQPDRRLHAIGVDDELRDGDPVGAQHPAVDVDQRFRDAILNNQALLKELLLGRCHRFLVCAERA